MRTPPKVRVARARTLLVLDSEIVNAVDRWGQAEGIDTRATALRVLLLRALRAEGAAPDSARAA